MFSKVVEDMNKCIDAKAEKKSQEPLIDPLSIFNDSHIRESLTNIDSLEDKDLYGLLKNKYKYILESIFEKEDSFYIDLFRNTRFVTIFIHVISSVVLDHTDRVYCNKISYDYLTSTNNDSDEYLKSLFFNMSKIVNKDIIPSLIGLGLEENFSSYLALSRYSSTKEYVNVRRVNYLIIASDPNLMTEQMIIFIYEKLFDNFTNLFKATMFDPYTDEELSNISSGASEIYSNMSLAIIDIMNVMPSDDIRTVLLSYSGDYNVSNDLQVRFSINSLNVVDYERILYVALALEREEMIFIP